MSMTKAATLAQNATQKKYGVFYALGDKFIRAAVEDGSVRDKVGTTVRLNVRSLHERGESCPHRCTARYCCTNEPDKAPCVPEETREYKIVRVKVIEGDGQFGGDDGVDAVLHDREWEDLRAYDYNRDFFDWYFAANILGIIFRPLDYFPLTGSIIVDLE
jgi:hypothetical protein